MGRFCKFYYFALKSIEKSQKIYFLTQILNIFSHIPFFLFEIANFNEYNGYVKPAIFHNSTVMDLVVFDITH